MARRVRKGEPGRVCRPACKPGPVPALPQVTVIYLASPLPTRSSGLPRDRGGPGRPCPLLDLASGGVCRAGGSPRRWCALTLRACAPHHFTLTEGSGESAAIQGVGIGKWSEKSEPRSPLPTVRYRLPTADSPLPPAVSFCCTFPPVGGTGRVPVSVTEGGRYPPPRPVKPGLSSPIHCLAATVRPTNRLELP